MYCGDTNNLSKEHIVPYGLGGPGVIPASSCSNCAQITSKFEMDVLRSSIWGLRSHLKLSTRRRNKMPKELPLILVRDKGEEEVNIPIEEHPVLLSFPLFSPPSMLTGNHIEGIHIRGANLYGFGAAIEKVLKEYNAKGVKTVDESKPVSFARMIAKIAWGIAVAEGLINQLDERLGEAIINKPSDIGRWVGTYTDPPDSNHKLLHEIKLRKDEKFLYGDVQLFAATKTPRYGVILGCLNRKNQ